VELFFGVADARQKLERWRRDYNEQRPHSALGGLAPLAYSGVLWKNQWKPRQANFLKLGVSSDWMQVTETAQPDFRLVSRSEAAPRISDDLLHERR